MQKYCGLLYLGSFYSLFKSEFKLEKYLINLKMQSKRKSTEK